MSPVFIADSAFSKVGMAESDLEGQPLPYLEAKHFQQSPFCKKFNNQQSKEANLQTSSSIVSIDLCIKGINHVSFETLTMQALLFHLSAFSTNPKVGGLISGVLRGGVTPCTWPKRGWRLRKAPQLVPHQVHRRPASPLVTAAVAAAGHRLSRSGKPVTLQRLLAACQAQQRHELHNLSQWTMVTASITAPLAQALFAGLRLPSQMSGLP